MEVFKLSSMKNTCLILSKHRLTLRSKLLLGKFTDLNPVQKFSALYSPQFAPLHSQINPVNVPIHFLETHLILPPPSPQSTPRSPKRHVSLRVSHQRSACISVPLHACYKPAHHILLNFITLIISGETFLDIKYLYSVRQLMPTASAAAE